MVDHSLVPIGNDNVEISRVGLRINRKISFEDWQDLGYTLGGMERAFRWSLGDWIIYGHAKYGEMYAQALHITGFEYGYLTNLAYVCSNVPISLRSEHLGISHHILVAKLNESPEEQRSWLYAAIKNDWSTREMREEMQKANALPPPRQIEQKGSNFNNGLEDAVVRYIRAVRLNKQELAQDAWRLMCLLVEDKL